MYVKAILLIFLIYFGNSLSDKDKKSKSEEVFVASKQWKEIKEGQKVPSGLHYRINLSTGKKEARLIDSEDNRNEDLESKRFTMQEQSNENGADLHSDKEMERILKEVNKKNPESDMPKKFRTLEELKKELGDINLQPKSDIEVIKELFKKFNNEEKKNQPDDNVILGILRDLKYLGHQIDNGNEFYKLDGFRKIVYKELNSTSPTIKQEALKLFSVMVQNNPKVKVHVLETGGITTLLRIMNLEDNPQLQSSALTALSCTLRTFPYAQNKFIEIGGLTIFTELFKSGSIKLKLKIVTLLNDLIIERQKDILHFENHEFIDVEKALFDLSWCDYLNGLLEDLIVIDINDFDSIEKCLLAMKSMKSKCKQSYKSSLILKLNDQYSLLGKENKDDTADYFQYLIDLISNFLDNNSIKPNREEL